ncbi:MAG: xylose isomerase, partial [Deltaproteobacteria bacterium]|nr:xylose isomerase [Deltaproteobacteria bacterium]
ATLEGHSFQHEIEYALAHDLFGSLDVNCGDSLLGWDTDQFPNDVGETTLAMYSVLRGGGLRTGGCNFDAKLRRQSIAPEDLLHAHVGGIDALARGLENACRMLDEGSLEAALTERYAGWDGALGAAILAGELDLAALAERVEADGLDPQPVSGRQEWLENLVNRHL